jgi:branched-chain amino acid transport system substrate-binding protein
MKQLTSILFVCALLLTACAQTTEQLTTQEPQTITVGFIGPLSGDAASVGDAMKKGIELGVADVNARGGVNGKQLVVVYEDGACSGKTAASAAQKLITQDHVNVILGGVCSGESLAAIPVAEASEVLLFSAGSSSPELTNRSKYFVRNYPSDAAVGATIAETMIAKNQKKAAVMSEQTDYARAMHQAFTARYEELGGQIVAEENYAQSSSDFRTQLTKMIAAKPDALFIVPQTPPKVGQIIQQIDALAYTGQVYSSDLVESPDVLTEYSDEAEGVIYATGHFDKDGVRAKQLFDKFTTAYGSVPDGLPPLYLAAAYDNPHILAAAMEECGETDADCMQAYIRSLRGYEGVAFTVNMRQTGDIESEYDLKIIKDGQAVALN